MEKDSHQLLRVLLLFLLGTAAVRTAEICCARIGCFSDDPPHNGLPLPHCFDDLDMDFKVYVQGDTTTGYSITRDIIPDAFDGQRRSIYLVTGWQKTQNDPWMTTVKNSLLAQGDYNIIIVGWNGGAQHIDYYPSESDARTAGAELALVVNSTINNGGSDPSSTYCIGYGLGAHVCGYAGEKRKFGRITGISPVGPDHDDREVFAGLNPTHADLVDVIHTDGLPTPGMFNIGSQRRRGHVDFYVNGGGRQPSCVPLITPAIIESIPTLKQYMSMNLTTIEPDVSQVIRCNHKMSLNYFIESIVTQCFLSRYHDCTDINDLPASCDWSLEPVQSMGFDSDSYTARGVFYLTANSASPFCQG